ncbi:hypothetical protein U27_06263 [Candidatus Vecturithrix granuli]|uniref:Uncharacterized protein n=1 Tax=Vecturithrix granuli TaxID=1499967 RepID=A0A081C3Y1_VECG1|nr:hypothetical protein U27_06263 [Candidatus Vecturithrix granuli]
MENKPRELIEEIIKELNTLLYQDKDNLQILLQKTVVTITNIFGAESPYIQKIKSISFIPKTSYFPEMSEQVHSNSWNSGKEQLLSILNIVLKDLETSAFKSQFSVRDGHTEALKNLQELLRKVKNPQENDFLQEAIKCFEVAALRATVIMVWNLTIDHLYEYILANKIIDFNRELAKNTDRRIKITAITQKDDFSEIPENKFLEFCRAGNIISNDVRKILDTKLGIRNTCAHPSNIKIYESKVIDFIEDLVSNVVLKFNI